MSRIRTGTAALISAVLLSGAAGDSSALQILGVAAVAGRSAGASVGAAALAAQAVRWTLQPSPSVALRPASAPGLAMSPVPTPLLSPIAGLAPMPVAAPEIPAAPVVPAAVLPGLADAGQKLAQLPTTNAAAVTGAIGVLGGLYDNAHALGDAAAPAVESAQVPGGGAGLPAPVRSLESIKELRVGSYNVENLFEQVGKHIPDPVNPGHLKKVSDARPKPEWAMREEGRIILEQKLDVVTVVEVEDIAALRDFNERFLNGLYNVYLIEGNDERGIDISFLVKKDLPFQVEQRSHKGETWVDPVLGGGPKLLFSRDLTSLIFRAPGRAEPLLILFGTHYKSKRDRDPRDPESKIIRAAQVQRTAEIVKRYQAEFGPQVPIMLDGDFNGAVDKETLYRPLFEAAGLTDSFDVLPNPASEKDRITHSYHPRGGGPQYSQLDAVLVSKNLRGAVKTAQVYRYKNPDGTERPLPTTFEEREKNPSDHFPLIVTLDFAPIRTGIFPDWRPISQSPLSR